MNDRSSGPCVRAGCNDPAEVEGFCRPHYEALEDRRHREQRQSQIKDHKRARTRGQTPDQNVALPGKRVSFWRGHKPQ